MNRFHTNLDLAQPFVRQLQGNTERFEVGDCVRFSVDVGGHAGVRVFDLRVCARTFDVKSCRWVIELHLPTAPSRSIREWEEWFRRHIRGEDF